MKNIPLTQGKFALVDDADFEWLNQWKWRIKKSYQLEYVITDTKIGNKKTTIRMHRLILNAKKDIFIDPKDNNGLNNCRDNLRVATNGQNNMNRSIVWGVSKYKGVYQHKTNKKWIAQIKKNKKLIRIGHFNKEIEAARAYDKRAKELFGEFARPNF